MAPERSAPARSWPERSAPEISSPPWIRATSSARSTGPPGVWGLPVATGFDEADLGEVGLFHQGRAVDVDAGEIGAEQVGAEEARAVQPGAVEEREHEVGVDEARPGE